MYVLITRPQAQAATLARRLEAAGHTVLIEPLLAIEPVPDVSPDLEGVQALVLTSANAVPALRGTDRTLPAFVVGGATAKAARAAGCTDVRVAEGNAVSLARLIAKELRPGGGMLLHLCGTEVRPGLDEALAAAGFGLRRQAVYRAVAARRLSAAAVAGLRARAFDAVLLFSPRTAEILVALVRQHGLSDCLARTEAICLSEAVAGPCHALNWKAVRVAARPEVEMLLGQLEGDGRRC